MNKLIPLKTNYTDPDGLLRFKPTCFADDRGNLTPLFSNQDNVYGSDFKGIKQVNLIKTKKNVLRGAHVSKEAQHKIIVLLKGIINHMMVELREGKNFPVGTSHTNVYDADVDGPIMIVVPPFVASAIYSHTKATILYATDTYFDENLELSVCVGSEEYFSLNQNIPVVVSDKDSKTVNALTASELINEHNRN